MASRKIQQMRAKTARMASRPALPSELPSNANADPNADPNDAVTEDTQESAPALAAADDDDHASIANAEHHSLPPRSSLPAIEPLKEDASREEGQEEGQEGGGEAPPRPSASMTREMPALAAHELFNATAAATGSNPRVPAAPPTIRAMDDLAVTAEGPAAQPRLLLLDVTESLLEERNLSDITEEEIASQAGVSLDIFHAHFASKAALLAALCERFCEQAILVTNDSTHSGIWDRAKPRDVVEVGVRSILDIVLGRSALVRAVLMSGDPALLDGFRRVGANVTARVNRALNAHAQAAKGAATTDKPSEYPDARDVAFAFLLAVSLAHHAIMVGTLWSGIDFEREEIYERASRAATAYLEESMKRSRASLA